MEAMQTQINQAIAAGCLQTVMSLVHPELTKYVEFQRARVARTDSSSAAAGHGRRQSREEGTNGAVAMHADQQTDISTQLKYLRDHWRSHLRFHGGDPELPMIVQRAILYRNKVSHQSDMALHQYEEAISTYEKLAELIECNVIIRRQIREVVDKMLPFSSISSAAAGTAPTSISTGVHNSRSSGTDVRATQLAREPSEERDASPATAGLVVSVEDPSDSPSELYDQQETKRNDLSNWEDLRSIGSDKFKAGDYQAAIECYTRAIEIAPNEPILLSNRATGYLKLKEFELARDDAEDALDLDTEVVKHYRLLSEALMGLQEYNQAREVCEEGLVLDASEKTLLSRKKAASAMIEQMRQEKEVQKVKKREEERRQAAETYKEGKKAVRQASPAPSLKPNGALPQGTALRSINATALGIADPIKYSDVALSDIDVQQRGAEDFELYCIAVEIFVEAGVYWIRAIELRLSGKIAEAKVLAKKTVESLKNAGEVGLAGAWYRMGVLFSGIDLGLPLVKNLKQQVDKFHKAAACKPFVRTPTGRVIRHAGVAEAENELGVMFRDGNALVSGNLDQAFTYFLRSAQHDFAIGQLNVAKAYLNGEGTAKDVKAARFWVSRAAQHGLADGQALLARMLQDGVGGPRDATQARLLLEESRENKKLELPADRNMSKKERSEWWMATDTLDPTQPSDYLEYLSEGFDLFKWEGISEEDSSYSTQMDRLHRPITAAVKEEIDVRANGGGLTASKYLIAQRLIERAQSLLEAGDADEGLNALRRADELWECPGAMLPESFLTAALNVARVRYGKNPKNIDAAYAVGRWDIVNHDDQVRHWKKCAKLNPSEPSLSYHLGVACWNSGLFAEAHDALSKALVLKQDPRWLYMLGVSKQPNGGLEAAYPIFKEYVAKNPPDEKFVPDAYFSMAALHLSRLDLETGLVYYGVAQAAESPSIRFPALLPSAMDMGKKILEAQVRDMGLLETTMPSDVMTGSVLPCEFCQDKVKPSQVLMHKLSKCPRRRVMCRDCDKEVIFDELAAHQESKHKKPSASRKKRSPLRSKSPAAKLSASRSNVAEVGKVGRLPDPKFHFFGKILEIIPGKGSKPPVLALLSEAGDKWELRVTASAASSILGATVEDSIVVFWRSSPTVDAIGRRSLRVPQSSSNEQYGRDVVLHVTKLSVQAVASELKQLRQVNHVEHGAVCSYCSSKPTTRLSVCGACKRVKYCSRDCQSIHWKAGHRAMCKNVELLDQCLSKSVNIAPDRYPDKPLKDDASLLANGLAVPGNTLDILRDVLYSFEAIEGQESSFECELPVYGGGELKSRAITGSVRFFRDKRTRAIWSQFRVGYLTSTPTQSQQQELVTFFHLPPHNPLQLKYQDKMVHLERCKVFMDDTDGKGFRLGMDVALDKLPAPALAELLDYLITNTAIYLS